MPNEPEPLKPSPAVSTRANGRGTINPAPPASPRIVGNGAPANAVTDRPTAGTKVGTFYSLRFLNYRLLWIGTLFTSAGLWIQQTTLGWVVYDMTGSSTLLGAISAAGAVPMLLLMPLAGVAADRLNRKLIMLVSQLALFLFTVILGVMLAMDLVSTWHLFVFIFLVSLAQVFNQPVRQTVVFDLVPRVAIPNAVALNSAGFNATRALGPSVAGFLILLFGPAGNFFVQSVAYFAVVVVVLLMTFPPTRGNTGRVSVATNLAEGFQYVAREPTVRMLMLLAFIPPILVMPAFMTLMPVFAKDVFHSGPAGLGLLLSANGVGGLLGALFTASLGRFENRGMLLLFALLGVGLSGIGFAFSSSMEIALPLLAVSGFCGMVYMTTNQTVLQLLVPDHIRGRVTSILMLGMGLMPLGGLLAGAGADVTGAPEMVALLSSATVLLVALMAVFMPRVRALRLSELNQSTSGQRPTAGA